MMQDRKMHTSTPASTGDSTEGKPISESATPKVEIEVSGLNKYCYPSSDGQLLTIAEDTLMRLSSAIPLLHVITAERVTFEHLSRSLEVFFNDIELLETALIKHRDLLDNITPILSPPRFLGPMKMYLESYLEVLGKLETALVNYLSLPISDKDRESALVMWLARRNQDCQSFYRLYLRSQDAGGSFPEDDRSFSLSENNLSLHDGTTSPAQSENAELDYHPTLASNPSKNDITDPNPHTRDYAKLHEQAKLDELNKQIVLSVSELETSALAFEFKIFKLEEELFELDKVARTLTGQSDGLKDFDSDPDHGIASIAYPK